MDEQQKNVLRENHVSFVNDIEPRGEILDSLYEKGILTENDIEYISSAPTRKQRCQLLLSLLPTRGPVAYGSFQVALKGQYDYLARRLEVQEHNAVAVEDVVTNVCARDKPTVCDRCEKFLANLEPATFKTSLMKVIGNLVCPILDNVESFDLIDQLFQDKILNKDDIDCIRSRVTRRDRCETLLAMLLSLDNEQLPSSLILSLTKKYSYIVSEMLNNIQEFQRSKVFKSDARDTSVETDTKTKDVNDNALPSVSEMLSETQFSRDKFKISGSKGAKVTEENSFDSAKSGSLGYGCDCVDSGGISHVFIMDRDIGVDIVPNEKFPSSDKSMSKLCSNIEILCNKQAICTQVPRIMTHLEQSTNESKERNQERSTRELTERHQEQNTRESTERHREQCTIESTETNMQLYQQHVDIVSSTKHKSGDADNNKYTENELIRQQITAVHAENPSRRLSVAFNYLSTLINQGDFEKFETTASKLQKRFSLNYDLMCIIGYLKASRDLFRTQFDSAKDHISQALVLASKTSNPRYFTLELFTAKTRMYITQKKLEKLQTTLDEAMMILETDPVGCTGRAAGWLYINHARYQTAQMSCLNLRKPNAFQLYDRLFNSAKISFQRSITNFKRDGGKDGPFGFGYALCRLVILLLRCGDNGFTMKILTPSADDVTSAGQYLQHLENSDVVISKILEMHFRLAKCDYQYRRNNFVRAMEHAEIALDLAKELNLAEFTEHAHNRVTCLRSKMSNVITLEELNEEEVNRILFEESGGSESEINTQSD